jgi:hypothetical protein
LGRPFDKHIDNEELNALVPSSSEAGQGPRLSADAVRDAKRHVASCADCSGKVSKYEQLVNRLSSGVIPGATPAGVDCPSDEDVDWHEIAVGLWPELKAKQLIMHAALCDHCGPRLRAATSLQGCSLPREENLAKQQEATPPPAAEVQRELLPAVPVPPTVWQQVLQWKTLVPAVALTLVIAVLGTRPTSTRTPLSGPQFAEFAVSTYRQHAQGSLALEVYSDSQLTLNEWFKTKRLSLVLPASPAAPGEERPYRLEGARLVQIGGKTAAFVAYQMPTAPMPKAAVTLIVAPDSVAVASGGVEANFKKVSFHYATVEGYKVVTWSLHGLTYALVSQEGNNTQRSCMVCHSAMRDRDLTHTPTPMSVGGNGVEPVWQ